jgi:lysozyme
MKISNQGIELIVEFEGEILEVYKDPVGLPTLGVGHLLTREELRKFPVGTPISKATSRAYLRADLKRFEDALSGLIEVPVTQSQFDALLSLAFNIGEENFTKSSVLRKTNKKDFVGAAAAFMSWTKARNKAGKLVVLPGLVRRRKAERALYLAPDTKPAISASDLPASGGGETQTKPSDPPPSSSFSVSDALESFLGAADRVSDAEVRLGRSVVMKSIGSKAIGLALLALSYLLDNWEVTLIGGTVLVASIGYLIYKLYKKRKAKQESVRTQ